MAAKRAAKESRNDNHGEGFTLPLNAEARKKALDIAMEDLDKRFGEGTIVRLGDAKHMQVDVISTGSLTADIATGVGGVPRGRVIEIYGPESSGKTTLCLHTVAEAQKKGGLCAFVDMEHALDTNYAQRIGVNTDTLYISQPDTAEQALEIVEALVRSGALDVIVLDSVAALVPRVEIEGEMGDSHVGVQARLMSQALRKLSGAIKQSNVAVLFTNQLRDKIGVMYGCMDYDTRVMLADGTSEKIGLIVEKRLPVEVLSYNVKTRAFEPGRIANYFDNGYTEEFLRITVASLVGEPHQFTCTCNHLILSQWGYEHAVDLQVGDLVIAAEPVAELATGFNDDDMLAKPFAMPILKIEALNKPSHRYDIEIAGKHCYVVDGVVVHNSPETTSGGRALKFYASMRLDVRKLEAIKSSGGDTIGSRTRIRVTKNKVAPPFREAEFDIMFLEGGISKSGEIIDLATEMGIIEKRGAFYRYNNGLLGQGREASKQYLIANLPIRDEIEATIRQHYGLGGNGKANGAVPAPVVAPAVADVTDDE